MSARQLLALWAGKITAKVSLLAGGRGSSLPGRVALRFCPSIIDALAQEMGTRVIVVTGTNGKTTVNHMLTTLFSSLGYRVVANREGANMASGLASALVRSASWRGRLDSDWALLEVDEASFPRLVPELRPAMIVVTNFFRDQLDRYGELDHAVELIRSTLARLPCTKLVLNADDPLVTSLAFNNHPALFYGIGAPVRRPLQEEGCREARFCPRCGCELIYLYYHYSQLGAYRCPGCGFARPAAQVEALEVRLTNGHLLSRVRVGDRMLDCQLPTLGFYNLYNALAVLAVSWWLGLAPERVVQELSHYLPATGRLQHFWHGDRQVYLNLVKNPAGFNEGLRLLGLASGRLDVLMALNDNEADGRDVSWIWDVDFESLLPAEKINSVICSGRRAADMALRLHYAGVPTRKIRLCPGLDQGVREVLGGSARVVHLLVTYTALWPVEKLLKRYVREEGSNAADLSSLP
ncbi:MurT ligase domain-containing protein [Desulfothermobacter acidiphilus]|uniref:MurT ligase domain-containing protein n=1 Tax=Desulfothermobacter acidiphilus TaxID=1938353 RepID=UPI003F8A4DA5